MSTIFLFVFPDFSRSGLRVEKVYYLFFKNLELLFHLLLPSLLIQSISKFHKHYPKHTCPQDCFHVIPFHHWIITSLWDDDFFLTFLISLSYNPFIHNGRVIFKSVNQIMILPCLKGSVPSQGTQNKTHASVYWLLGRGQGFS